jgi:hypothetical protein
MKRVLLSALFIIIAVICFAQVDTLSTNIYQLNGKLGIGNEEPASALSISGSENAWPGRFFIHVKNTSTSGSSAAYLRMQSGPTESATALGHISSTYTMNDDYEEIRDYGRLTSSGPGLMIDATKGDMSGGIIKFTSGLGPGTAFKEHMRITPEGNIGIGTASPNSKLEVANGDIFITDIDKGVIMKSPDGSCWRGTVDNSGTLNFVMIDCPGSVVGINEPTGQDQTTVVKIFPNPASNVISIKVDGDNSGLILKIYSLDGKLVEKRSLYSPQTEINIATYAGGEYLFIVEDKTGNFVSSARTIKE